MKYLYENSAIFRNSFKVLCVVCAALFVLGMFTEKHPYFEIENFGGFYAIFGLVAYLAIVLAGKYILRPLVKRKEDYYE
jgi:hypothetical protein